MGRKTNSNRRLILRQAAIRALLRIAARRKRRLRENGQQIQLLVRFFISHQLSPTEYLRCYLFGA